MNTDNIGSIAKEITLMLVHMGLTDAEISFVGTCLMSYAIGSTIKGFDRNRQESMYNQDNEQ